MRILLPVVLVASACGGSFSPSPQGLPVLNASDPDAAARGWNLLSVSTVSEPAIPRVAIENLSVVWPDGGTYAGNYWTAFRERYGLHEAPFDNAGLPMGIRDTGHGYVTFDCLLCHASTVAGVPMVGVANSTLDVQGLLDDLTAAAKLAGIEAPVTLTHRTGAAGATDAVGMAFALGSYSPPAGVTLNTEVGFERAPAWWQLKHKTLTFNDGSGDAPSFRTMAGTLLAFGLSEQQIAARADEFIDIGNWILALPAPEWPFGKLDGGRWKRGQTVFDETCASCHGTYHDDASFPDRVLAVDVVGTDPVRATKFRKEEADAINTTWFGTPPMRSTGGYLAPTLVGIWARAPYLHNGSVPDLTSVLDSSARPDVWQRTGILAADFDEQRVGWRYTVPADPGDETTIEGRKTYDTSRAGLGNGGHTFGDALSGPDRSAVIEYLKSL